MNTSDSAPLQPKPHSTPAVYAALMAVQLFFGINYYATKVVLIEVTPRAWAGIRITVAAILLLIWHTVFLRRYPTWKDSAWLALFAVFGILLNQILFIEGLARTTPTHSALIGTTIPVLTLLFAVMMGNEFLRPVKILGILLSLCGVWWLLGIGSVHFNGEQRLGDLLSIFNCVAFALFLVISRRVISQYDAITSTTFLMLFGAFGIDLVCASQLKSFFLFTAAHITWKTWIHAAYVIVFPTVVTYVLNYWALQRVDASIVAVFIYIQPVIAALLSVMLLGDTITLRMLGSTALIFSGVFLTSPQVQQWLTGQMRRREKNLIEGALESSVPP